jgi:hypothetical protein
LTAGRNQIIFAIMGLIGFPGLLVESTVHDYVVRVQGFGLQAGAGDLVSGHGDCFTSHVRLWSEKVIVRDKVLDGIPREKVSQLITQLGGKHLIGRED